jgi:DNA-directed RNA polymerase subunit L
MLAGFVTQGEYDHTLDSCTHTLEVEEEEIKVCAYTWTHENGAAELRLQLCLYLSYIVALAKSINYTN